MFHTLDTEQNLRLHFVTLLLQSDIDADTAMDEAEELTKFVLNGSPVEPEDTEEDDVIIFLGYVPLD
jgi:hypothetical protein